MTIQQLNQSLEVLTSKQTKSKAKVLDPNISEGYREALREQLAYLEGAIYTLETEIMKKRSVQ